MNDEALNELACWEKKILEDILPFNIEDDFSNKLDLNKESW